MEVMQDQQFVEQVVKALVNHPEDVRTERTVDEMGVLITLHINQEDMGYVIGRRGQTARALRTLLRIVGAKNNARVNLKIYEPDEVRRARQERMESEGRSDRGDRGGRGPRPNRDELEDIDTSAVDDLKI
ncbi:hypothetical protein A3H10_00185 [Candidatus Uhrbacteria bacterium RIFCSPLOWO2_12_FULL_46_10]|uniref:RNA-binding protein KhpA n=1 Tax=Candidatus Uhrbacteria bacterium RIFCSPLOWO2_01_FULL_47_25 TaxID=1802402 RepID=A0A1F7UVY5_9BACT|nr:MAG: hypothetical protein UX68_C0018G0010 [Parcubacteria group bacterium GW2011_GWA2_46_9]OGL58874.1 MAG: hypothetical protein A2752_04820 [Candidatus Uhrbacteria bacterium RIFCSPHIGHO2_01_FULL_46_23]OGL69398.1 MAG: hypothetical protein A3D60_00975 [Candidatus Uhrbacteria bacterium RIFCSPHIGHO2_02_FULL_47_29]OGL76485.1 MAG: hypothetical protein A3E96_03180 [Candidatus Uhrbacteria bacterium RIFCSPHIGHO2_12_FULL_46_13]OGL82440.1 MAG: hypothetical protein A2936_03215 [Candidatus Uhrbacteria bac